MRIAQLFCTLLLIVAFSVAPVAQAQTAPAIDGLIDRVQSMMEEMAKVQVQLQALKAAQTGSTPAASSNTGSTPTGSVLGANTFKFSEDTIYGATNDDVKRIQELLATDKEIYPDGITSGFFGPATQRSIRNLQERFGLDPVGVVGPATTALLERLISQRNTDGTYPSDILDPARPTGTVAGATTNTGNTSTIPPNIQALLDQVAQLQQQTLTDSTPSTGSTSGGSSASNSTGIDRIEAQVGDRETLVKVFYQNGNYKDFWVGSEEEDDVIEEAADELNLSESVVEDLMEIDDFDYPSSGDADDIDEIRIDVDVEDGEAAIEVEYDDGDTDDFDVDEVDLEDIIKEIADELDIDEDDVWDIMEVDYNVDADEIDEINVSIDDDEAEITVELDSGDDFELWLAEDDEDDILEFIAEILDIDEDEAEDLTDF